MPRRIKRGKMEGRKWVHLSLAVDVEFSLACIWVYYYVIIFFAQLRVALCLLRATPCNFLKSPCPSLYS